MCLNNINDYNITAKYTSTLQVKNKLFHINFLRAMGKILLWQNENQDAIKGYNQRIQRNGVFSDGIRQF